MSASMAPTGTATSSPSPTPGPSKLLPVPEELVACILELLMRSLSDTLTSTTTPSSFSPSPTTTPSLSSSTSPSNSPSPSLSTFTPTLLVNSAFHRIAKPILYRALHLKSESQARKLADVVFNEPSLGACVRSLRVDGPLLGPAFEKIVQRINTDIPLQILDVKLDHDDDENAQLTSSNENFASFARALQGVKDVRKLILRKSGYLTKVSTRQAVYEIAVSLVSWKNLEHVEFKYKISPLPATSAGMFPSLEEKLLPLKTSPNTNTTPLETGALSKTKPKFTDPLALALSHSPNLKVIRAQMPALYNSFLADVVSTDACIERIELLDGSEDLGVKGNISGSSYPFPNPRPHPRSRGMSDAAPSPSSPIPSSPSTSTSISSSAALHSTPSTTDDDERKNSEKRLASKIATPTPTSSNSISDETAMDSTNVQPPAIPAIPTSLFMQQASKHPRLHALVLAGRRHMFLRDMGVVVSMPVPGGRRGTSRRPPPQPLSFTTGPGKAATTKAAAAAPSPSPTTGARTRAHSALPATPTSLVMRGR